MAAFRRESRTRCGQLRTYRQSALATEAPGDLVREVTEVPRRHKAASRALASGSPGRAPARTRHRGERARCPVGPRNLGVANLGRSGLRPAVGSRHGNPRLLRRIRQRAEGEQLARSHGLDDVQVRVARAQHSLWPIWRTLLDVADEVDAELIVLGTHGLRVVESELLGSVSNSVLHHARRPALVVPACAH